MTETTLEAYCVRCKEKRPLKDPQPVFTAAGRPATKGACPVCGTTLFRMGATPAHEGMDPPPPPQPEGRLVIVESPAKARTVGRFLGRGYTVRASVGHVRDLLRSSLSVDVENGFQPTYRVPNEKKQVVKELAEEVKKAAEVYLATDPDREGEAIAWHLAEVTGIRPEKLRRVVFHEITQSAIEEAFAHPRGIDMNLVNAQQARRILDRLVGYSLSPLLWRKVRSRLSAGRVQSVAVRMVVEREREIQNFVPEEYWSIQAELAKREARRRSFLAKLHRIRGEEVNLKDEPAARAVVEELERSVYVVVSVKEGQRRRQPAPPFTTSTMQQEASRRLGFTATRTMRIAQQLYEGIDLDGSGPVGLITYMRTDSTNVAEQAQQEARQYIAQRYGESFLPPQPPVYKTKTKGAQEAHEAIRPTSVFREPDAIKDQLTRDQYRLYQLIWQRFVASQMPPALYDTVAVDIEAGPADGEKPYLFRATGSTLRFPGFLIVYEEAKDEDVQEEEPIQQIPPLQVGEVLDLVRLIPEQHFTQPPPRYTEATLVRALEEYGIGRPSTYAPILATIQQRGYVRREGRRLVPTELGFLVNDLLVEHFPEVMDYEFTAQMEEQLDEIAAGRREWVPVVREFYLPFARQLEEAERRIEKVEVESTEVGRNCPECGAPLTVRWGRYGKFIGCSRFPECRYTEPWQEKVGATCPQCGGDLVEKRTRKGRVGYGCVNYPTCNFWVWQRPLPFPCPACDGLMVEARRGVARCVSCGEEVVLEEADVEV
ncbi:MAG: type I DNA topoisomerase [Anaerolineae bacterium]|nr:type I DNA topoisomerase [Anaerolineae bacterium]MDW7990586.1 type I DNA topoisomerase [Anaerolineae bacterium]